MCHSRKRSRHFASNCAIQVCPNDDGNLFFGVISHVRVKANIVPVVFNNQAAVYAIDVQTASIVTPEMVWSFCAGMQVS